jgi:anti-sigma B factor antagonist
MEEGEMELMSDEVRDGLLTVVVARNGSAHTIALSGELDMANVDTFAARLEASEAEGADSIVIDLSALKFVDSTGIATLVAADHRLNQDGRRRLTMIPSRALAVTRVMETTGLDATLPFVDGNVPDSH